MTKANSSVRVYFLDNNDFVLVDRRGRVINRHSTSFERDDKTAIYRSQTNSLVIAPIHNGYENPQKQSKEFRVIDLFDIPKSDYQLLLNKRLEGVRTYWEREHQLEELLKPYLGEKIPSEVLAQRNKLRKEIPQPRSLMFRLASYRKNS